jgi:hypothetical protein
MFGIGQRNTSHAQASSDQIPTPRSPEATLTEALDLLTARYSLLDAAGDRRAAYCRIYARYVAALRREIAAGAFGATVSWLADLELDTARRYLRAIDGWGCRDMWSVPAPWRAAFTLTADASGDGIATALRAHLSYELPLAIARAGVARGAEGAFKRAGRIFAAAAPLYAHESAVLHAAAWREGAALAAAGDDQREAVYRRLQMDTMQAIVQGR